VRVNNRKWQRATPQWDDGKVLSWRQYEVAQEKLAAPRWLGSMRFGNSENQMAS
jgi:hypothetical protein